MGHSIFFKCSDCSNYIIMQWTRGWLDENGNFGYGMDPEFEVIGKPNGNWDIINFHDKICKDCGKKRVIIQGNLKKFNVKYRQMVQTSPDSSDKTEILVVDSEIDCPQCKIEMMNGEDLIPYVMRREKYTRMKLEPLSNEN